MRTRRLWWSCRPRIQRHSRCEWSARRETRRERRRAEGETGMLKGLVLACFLAAGVASAQEWEVGGLGGFGYAPDLTVKGPSGSASTGLKNGVVIGGFVGDDTYDHWSGEAHYLYRFSDLKLSSGGASVDFGAHTHI